MYCGIVAIRNPFFYYLYLQFENVQTSEMSSENRAKALLYKSERELNFIKKF